MKPWEVLDDETARHEGEKIRERVLDADELARPLLLRQIFSNADGFDVLERSDLDLAEAHELAEPLLSENLKSFKDSQDEE